MIEPSAACPLAAVMKEEFKALVGPDAKNIGIVLCGGKWISVTYPDGDKHGNTIYIIIMIILFLYGRLNL